MTKLMTKPTQKILNVKKGACKTTEPEHNVIPQLKPVPAFVMFVAILAFMSILGAVNTQFPTMLFISYFASAAVYTNIFKDSVFLNSICAPFAFISVADSIADIIYNTGALGIHLPVAIVIVILVNIRRKFDLVIMITASVLYAVWLYTIFWFLWGTQGVWVSDVLSPPFNNEEFLAIMSLVGMLSVCFGLWYFRSSCRSSIFPWAKKTLW